MSSDFGKAFRLGEISAKGSVSLFFGLVVSKVISATGTILVARMLLPADFGLFAIVMVPPTLLGLFRNWGVNSALIRYIAHYRSENLVCKIRSVIVSGLLFNSAVSLFLSFVSYSISGFVATQIFFRPRLEPLIQVASINILATCLFNTSQSIFTGFEELRQRSLLLILQSSIQAVLSSLLVGLGYGVFGVVLGVTVSFVIAGIVGLIMVYSKIFFEERRSGESNESLIKQLKDVLRYGYPLGLSAILLGFLPQFYHFLVSIYSSNAAIGNYSVALKFMVLLEFFLVPISATLFPSFSKLQGKKEIQDLKIVFQSSVKYTALLTIPLIACLGVLSEPLVMLFFGEEYSFAAFLLVLVVFTHVGPGFGSLSSRNLLNSQGYTRDVLTLDLIGIALGIPLSFVLIPRFGIIGMIMTSIIASMPGLLLGLRWVHQRYGFTLITTFSVKVSIVSAIAALISYMTTLLLRQTCWIEVVIGGLTFSSLILILIPITKIMKLTDIEGLKYILKGMGIVTHLSYAILDILKKLIRLYNNKEKRDERIRNDKSIESWS